ncbi:hypothetical protein Pint_19047 [Pistacia integerrima]|uniref:Uncharacterized protein n=1 Tax=Pistacia integerrima TaxID=434235 RepID=A0ACC0YW77_9ROSI|nr:hypothetical protein Pint_19047 [Pistacia integerrima]
MDMENQNGTSKPLIKQHSHSRQSSQEHFVFDNVPDHQHKLIQESTDSEEHFSSPEFGIQSPLQSPEPVTFSQSSGYDPKRIPQSVFSTRPTTPMEWSVASNESLFSIHLGNCSFSKENFVLLYKSGELPKVEDQPGKYAKPDEPTKVSKPDESNKVQPSSPTATKLADNMERILTIGEVNNNQKKTSPADARSEGSNSTTSMKSFHFPVLENDIGRHTSIKREQLEEEMENRRHISIKREILKEEKEKRPFTWHSQPQIQSSGLQYYSQSQEQLRPQSQTSLKTPKFGSNNSWFSCIPCLSPRTLIKRQVNN